MPPTSSDYGVTSSAPGLWSRPAEGRRGVTERFSAEPVPYLSQEPPRRRRAGRDALILDNGHRHRQRQ